MKHISIVAHLNSGGINGRNALARLQSVCRQRGLSYKVYISAYHQHTKKLVQEVVELNKDNEKHRLVVVGGDGTLNEAVSGLLEKEITYPICYFPSGTGNDFARSLNITNNEYVFLDNIFNSEIQLVDVIVAKDKINDEKYFSINGLGIGFDALVCNLAKKEDPRFLNKFNLGKLSYLLKTLEAFKKRENFSMNIKTNKSEEIYNDVLLATFMSKPYFGGGIKINPKREINDGKISLIFAQDVKGIDVIKAIGHIFTTEKHFEKVDKFTKIDGQYFDIVVDCNQLVQTDGEVKELASINFSLSITHYPFYLISSI